MDPWALVAGIAIIAAAIAVWLLSRQRGNRAAAERSLQDAKVAREAAIAERDTRYDTLADVLDDGMLELDADRRVTGSNPAAAVLLGRAADQLIGLTAIAVFLDPAAEDLVVTTLAQGQAVGEIRLRDADGPTLLLHGVRRPDGNATVFLRDVSELRRLQRIRTEFIDNLSHELRTPLTTVTLLAETLARDADSVGDALPPKMRDRIGKIEVETGHLVQMVSELLDLSRIESGTSLGPLEDVDLGRLADEAADRLRLFADRQGVSLAVEHPGAVPNVRGDRERLGQVLVNLVHNAVKFSPDGGPVTIAVAAADRVVEVSVADHGVGIPQAAQARIFERFYKVDRARVRGETGGTGLGLAIARHIIEQHHGRIWLESREGVGSTFRFTVPT